VGTCLCCGYWSWSWRKHHPQARTTTTGMHLHYHFRCQFVRHSTVRIASPVLLTGACHGSAAWVISWISISIWKFDAGPRERLAAPGHIRKHLPNTAATPLDLSTRFRRIGYAGWKVG
jgi:hypothetical protein